MRPGCRLARSMRRVLVPSLNRPRLGIDLESGAGHSTPGFSGNTPITGPAVPKMSSRAPGKIRKLRCQWERKNRFGEVYLCKLQYPTIGVRSLWGRQSGNLWCPQQLRMSIGLWRGWRMERQGQMAKSWKTWELYHMTSWQHISICGYYQPTCRVHWEEARLAAP